MVTEAAIKGAVHRRLYAAGCWRSQRKRDLRSNCFLDWKMSALLERAWPPEFAIEKLITESSANVEFLPSAIERTQEHVFKLSVVQTKPIHEPTKKRKTRNSNVLKVPITHQRRQTRA